MIIPELVVVYGGILGLLIGSFFNALEYRLAHAESVVTTKGKASRSKCPSCDHILGARDLVPVFSYVALRGKCRYCNKRISAQYPLVELATSAVWVVALAVGGANATGAIYALYGSILLFIFLYDLKHQMILDVITIPAIVFATAASAIVLGRSLTEMALGALIAGGFFAAQYIVSRGKWIGGGDIRLGILMGAMLGWQLALLATILAYVSGAAVGVVLLLKKDADMQSRMAFGTFLSAATFVCLLWGEGIIAWYIDLLI